MESNHNKKFDQQVKKKFEGFSVEVSPSLWATIEKKIKPEEVKINKVFNLKRYRFISVAAALFIIGYTIWKIQPEERIFLNGQRTVEETAFVQEPGFKQSTGDKINLAAVESKQKDVSEVMSKPASVAIAHDEGEDRLLQDSQIAIKKEIEETVGKLVLTVITPVDNDNASLINDVNTASAKTLDSRYESLDSLHQGPELARAETEERQNIVSGILNFVAGNLQIGGSRRVEFTENEHGIIKIGLKNIFAKNDR